MANVFDLFAKINLDDSGFKNGLSKVGESIGKFAKGAGVALAAGAAGVAALTKSSVEAYGDFEQLLGGVKKLYGNAGMGLEEYAASVGKTTSEVEADWINLNKAQSTVLQNAENAYKTSGMSMNTYMETATQFSASLINSLGGDSLEAARLTDMAMVAISDNWNTFGGDLEAISNAFKGFSKQNYNMLDNLKLGYGGTKSEMERLIADANEYAKTIGETSNLSIDSFADIIKAIDLVQKKQQIYGTTANEAQTTIQGSINMTKAAWENFLTVLGSEDGEIEAALDNLMESASYVFENILPVAERALGGIATAVEKLAPTISKKLPALVKRILPPLLNAATSLVTGLVQALPSMLEAIIGVLPGLIGGIVDAITGLLPELIPAGVQVVMTLAQAIMDNLSTILDAAVQIITMLGQGFAENISVIMPAIVDIILSIVDMLTDPSTIVQMIEVAVQIMVAIAEGLIQAIPKVVEKIPQILNAIKVAFLEGVKILAEATVKILTAIGEAMAPIVERFREIFSNAWEAVKNVFSSVVGWFRETFTAAKEAVHEAWSNIKDKMSERWQQVKDAFESVGKWFSETFTEAKNKATDAWNDIKAKFSEKWENIKSAFNNAKQWFSDEFSGAKDKAVAAWDNIKQKMDEIWEKIKSAFKFEDARNWGKDLINNFIGGIEDMWEWAKQKVSGFAGMIGSFIHFSEPDVGPLKDFHTFAPDMMKLFAQGIADNQYLVADELEKSLGYVNDISVPSVEVASSGYGVSGLDLVDAFQEALSGMGIYMDGYRVGNLVTKHQKNNARAVGA